MIAGWVIYYFVHSLSGTLYNIPQLSGTLSNEAIRTHYDGVFAHMNTSVIWPLLGSILAIILTGTVNFFGIKDGIEKFSKEQDILAISKQVVVATITSMISIFEIIISCISEKLKMSRQKATVTVILALLFG